jgi:molybdate transport system substrate-binding protein
MRRLGHLSFALFLLFVAPVSAAELKIFAAGAVQSVALATKADFERESGHSLDFAFGTVGALQNRVVAGEAADVTILSVAAIAELDRRSLTAAEPRLTIGTVSAGIASRVGAPRPKMSTPEELRESLLAARSISYGDPARGATAGIRFAGVLGRLGIAEAMQPKTVLVPFGVEAIDKVAKGEVELAASQSSEILATPGVELAGLLPPPHHNSTTYVAVMPAAARNRDAAAAYLRFLSQPAIVARTRGLGLAAPN